MSRPGFGAGSRSIPAYAGEPHPRGLRTAALQVYPRVCGGTATNTPSSRTGWGLSPRMRGNPSPRASASGLPWSIPAYAGEPLLPLIVAGVIAVYPRVCGGTFPRPMFVGIYQGLSPRMRGNQLVGGQVLASDRSIPAYAGEPRGAFPVCGHRGVYPRVCGGTRDVRDVPARHGGLSPRMRGNLPRAAWDALVAGSIPAYAGEPCHHVGCARRDEVYPRVCGGTAMHSRKMPICWGLSPRMRGNPNSAHFPAF